MDAKLPLSRYFRAMIYAVLCVQVEAIARAGKCRHLIIESTGISDPTPVAQALATSPSGSGGDSSSSSEGGDLSAVGGVSEGDTGDVGREGGEVVVEMTGTGTSAGGGGGGGGLYAVDTLVTVVDSTSFLDEVRKADDLEERGLEAEEGDTRTVADLLVSQAS